MWAIKGWCTKYDTQEETRMHAFFHILFNKLSHLNDYYFISQAWPTCLDYSCPVSSLAQSPGSFHTEAADVLLFAGDWYQNSYMYIILGLRLEVKILSAWHFAVLLGVLFDKLQCVLFLLDLLAESNQGLVSCADVILLLLNVGLTNWKHNRQSKRWHLSEWFFN